MAEEPQPGEKRTLSEASRELLKREVQQVENRLEEDYLRPIEMHKEAESFLAKLPPWPAIVCAVFGLLMALSAIPSSITFHRYSWSRQERLMAEATTVEEIERIPTGQNWRDVTLMLPFAIVAVGLTIWGRRHKLAYIGLALYAFSLGETALMAFIFERSDANARTALISDFRQKQAERAEQARLREAAQKVELEKQRKQMAEERAKQEAEARQRREAEQEAARRQIYERQLAEMDAAARAERERQRLEDERKKEEERQRKEAEEKKARDDEERRLAEEARAREARAKQLKAAEATLDELTASQEALQQKKEELQKALAEREDQIKSNAAQRVSLQEQVDAQDGIIRSCELTIDRLTERRAELVRIKAAAESRKQVDDTLKQANQRKANADKDKRDLAAQMTALQNDTRKAEGEIRRLTAELNKVDTTLDSLAAKVADTENAIRELQE